MIECKCTPNALCMLCRDMRALEAIAFRLDLAGEEMRAYVIRHIARRCGDELRESYKQRERRDARA